MSYSSITSLVLTAKQTRLLLLPFSGIDSVSRRGYRAYGA